jgi:hypothetical protein
MLEKYFETHKLSIKMTYKIETQKETKDNNNEFFEKKNFH